jgi:hypothetical protein
VTLAQAQDLRAVWPLASNEDSEELTLVRNASRGAPDELREQAGAILKVLEAENAACTLPQLADRQFIHAWLFDLRKALLPQDVQ